MIACGPVDICTQAEAFVIEPSRDKTGLLRISFFEGVQQGLIICLRVTIITLLQIQPS
jgi:hypothetical protein